MHRNGVSVFSMLGLAAAAAVLVLAAGSRTALAQYNFACSGPDCPYLLGYYSNAHTTGAPDATLRLVNDGFSGDSSPNGNLFADIYVFDAGEELIECCGCVVTPNGLLTLSVNTNLTSNTLTKVVPTRGVIKAITSVNSNPAGLEPFAGIHGWLTHIQSGAKTGSFAQTDEELTDSTLGSVEAADLAEDCGVLIELGSGAGVCSCTDAGR